MSFQRVRIRISKLGKKKETRNINRGFDELNWTKQSKIYDISSDFDNFAVQTFMF